MKSLRRILIGMMSFVLIFILAKFGHQLYWATVYNLKVEVANKINITYKGQLEKVHPIYDGTCFYVMLPAHWKENDLTYHYELNWVEKIFVNLDNIIVVKLQNASVFLTINSEELKSLDQNKKKKHSGVILCIQPNGSIEYEDGLKWIHGRGSSSWDYSRKKSYTLKLDKKSSLFGLEKSDKFCLLSNCFDGSHLKNKIALEIAERSELEFTPKTTFVNLWINGEYRGLYLLSNKIEVSKHGVNILKEDNLDKFGGFLCHIEQGELNKEKCGFISMNGQPVYIEYPEKPTKEQFIYFQDFFNHLEEMLKVKTSDFLRYINLESWSKYYLCQEILLNVDAGRRSFYLYMDKDSIDKVLYAGPIWDFDHSMSVWDNENWPKSEDELYVASGRGGKSAAH